jgi:GDPmannose 4,6-dehydratase
MGRRALITGITGQDGSYLSELLVSKGYEVHGLVRRVALEDPGHRLKRIEHIRNSIHLHAGSLESFPSVHHVLRTVQPDECYHLAAQSFVSYSFDDEFSTLQTNINGTHHVLAAIKDIVPKCRVYFAGSSEMFGKVAEVPQTENTRFHPRSAYGISKVAGFDLTRNYREAYGMHASNGILFNHESPRRGFEFVTRKITSGVARIRAGQASDLKLGNLDAHRDWGHAANYVEAMWLMLQQDQPDDYVVADSQLYRPAEVDLLVGNPAKAHERLGWSSSVSLQSLVWEMVESDCRAMGIELNKDNFTASIPVRRAAHGSAVDSS